MKALNNKMHGNARRAYEFLRASKSCLVLISFLFILSSCSTKVDDQSVTTESLQKSVKEAIAEYANIEYVAKAANIDTLVSSKFETTVIFSADQLSVYEMQRHSWQASDGHFVDAETFRRGVALERLVDEVEVSKTSYGANIKIGCLKGDCISNSSVSKGFAGPAPTLEEAETNLIKQSSKSLPTDDGKAFFMSSVNSLNDIPNSSTLDIRVSRLDIAEDIATQLGFILSRKK